MYDPMITLYLIKESFSTDSRYSHQVQSIPHINTRTILIGVREIKQAKGQKQAYIPIRANHYIQTIFLIHRSLWVINQDKLGEYGPTIGITKNS